MTSQQRTGSKTLRQRCVQETDCYRFKISSLFVNVHQRATANESRRLFSAELKSSLTDVVGVSVSPAGVSGSTHVGDELVLRNTSQHLEVQHYYLKLEEFEMKEEMCLHRHS